MISTVLEELNPYVIVVGSYAKGTNTRNSDIDLYVKKRSQEELDNDYLDELDEDYMTEVIQVLNKHEVEWDSLLFGYIHTTNLEIQVELSNYFKIHKNTEIKRISIFGVEMESATDDKNISAEELKEI